MILSNLRTHIHNLARPESIVMSQKDKTKVVTKNIDIDIF